MSNELGDTAWNTFLYVAEESITAFLILSANLIRAECQE
jgi:hypothetical protein